MKLGLGTVQFGMDYGLANPAVKTPAAEVAQILSMASGAGMTVIDTAMEYGDSEAVLGLADVSGWKVVTKLPMLPERGVDDIRAWVRNAVESSMKRLAVPKLHGLLLHKPEQLLGKNGGSLFDELAALRDEGKVRKIGVSIYDPAELGAYMKVGRVDLVQAPLNFLDRRMVTSGWLDLLQREGVEVHARSVFLQGLLLLAREELPAKFKRWEEVWFLFDKWLAETGMDRLEACLAYINAVPGIDAAIVGVNNKGQLSQILQAMNGHAGPFPDFMSTANPVLIDPRAWSALG